MKFSCTPISFRSQFTSGDMDIAGFIQTLAELGCGAIDLLSTQDYPWVWKDARQQMRLLPKLLSAAGLSLAAHGCGNNFAAADASVRQLQVQKVIEGIQEASELGAPVLRLFGGHIEPERLEAGMGSHVGIPLVMECLERVLPTAQRLGVVLALENHSNMPGHSFEIAAIIKHFDSPCLRCLFDCANFMGNSMDEPENPLRALDNLLPWIAHVHVKDVGKPQFFKDRKSEAYVTGQGDVPLRQLTAIMEKSGYQGFYSLEYEASFKVPAEQGVKASLAYLQNVAKLHKALVPSTIHV